MVVVYGLHTAAQSFSSYNTESLRALVLYQQDKNGYFVRHENVNLTEIKQVETIYAYDKKSKNLYMKTPYANCVVTLGERLAKEYKKNKRVPQLKEELLQQEISHYTEKLDTHFSSVNDRRRIFIQDSLAKVRADSLEQVRKDSIQKAEQQAADDRYRRTHKWEWVPTNQRFLQCLYCNSYTKEDSVFCIKLSNDSMFYMTVESGELDETYTQLHAAIIPPNLKGDEQFQYHCAVYKDSLLNLKCDFLNDDFIEAYNAKSVYDYVKEVEKQAPYGYFVDWGWNSEYSVVSFHCQFRNTNKKTIKYLNIFWKITNDVDDVRQTGHFDCTGPVEQYNSGSWNTEYSGYYVTGDATSMQITKVIITYMDGTKKVLTGNSVIFN